MKTIKSLFLASALLLTSMGAKADNVLYAVVSDEDNDGTNETMTLKYGDESQMDGNHDFLYTGSTSWTSETKWGTNLRNHITTANIDESCANYTGNTLRGLFYGLKNLTHIWNLSNLRTNDVENMYGMFNGCNALTNIDLSQFNTEKVTDMESMFAGCEEITSINLSTFNTAKVTLMSGMFRNCVKLTSLNLSMFNTDQITAIAGMFESCEKLTTIIGLNNFNTSNVTSLGNLFYNCYLLSSVDLSSFNTSNVKYMKQMFYNCKGLKSLDLSSFDTENVTDMNYLFYKCYDLKAIIVGDGWNTDKVTTATEMFYGNAELVGEDGTEYENYKNTIGYAHTGAGGLLTKKTVSISTTNVGGNYWTTYYKSNVNRVADENTIVYVADISGNKFLISKVPDRIIQAGQGVILKSTNSTIILTSTINDPCYSCFDDNILVGVDVETAQASSNNYVLSKKSTDDNQVCFRPLSDGKNLSANKAYYPANAGAPAYFDFSDDNTTDINEKIIVDEKLANSNVYNLNGQRVHNPSHGLYIVKGKKFVIE
jgi:surface protein